MCKVVNRRTIEAEEVRFCGNFPFYAYGVSLIAQGGSEVDNSIYFMNHVDDGISNWRGLRLYGYNNHWSNILTSYVSISGT